tara:strand:- start:1721 stop:2005 length:285 start_codon:yes stop_codon:yes gene_type:complete
MKNNNIRAVFKKVSPFLKSIVMGFKGNMNIKKTKPEFEAVKKDLKNAKSSLDQDEIGIILNLIKENSFKGKDLEIIYNLVIKLQDQYLSLEKEN